VNYLATSLKLAKFSVTERTAEDHGMLALLCTGFNLPVKQEP